MKKLIIALFLVTVLILVNKKETKVLIPEDAIRFRIIANSNKIEDQTQKLEIKKELEVDEVNDDSLGADFYEIDKLSKDELSSIAILELEKLGYKLK